MCPPPCALLHVLSSREAKVTLWPAVATLQEAGVQRHLPERPGFGTAGRGIKVNCVLCASVV